MKPYMKRLPVSVSYRDDILLYGVDNLYPQRVEGVVNSSPVAKSAIVVTGDFINGSGFDQNGETEAGKFTFNELLKLITDNDAPLYNSAALIYDVALSGQIAEITPVDFKYVRLGIPTKDTYEIKYAKFSIDWEEQLPVNLRPKPLVYPLWPGSAQEAKEILRSWDAETFGPFNGFLHYITPRETVYPLATLDSVLESAQTNSEIQIFELAGVQNGFQGATILKHHGKIADNEERRRIAQMVSTMRGAENANSVHVWEVPDGYDGEVLEQFPANNQDRLFENTNKTTVNRIVQCMAIPPSLLGIMPENSFFNQAEIEEAYRYFNVRTESRRTWWSRVFNAIGENMVSPVELGPIVPQGYTFQGAEMPEQPQTTEPPTDDAADSE
jgi:hypothetical protein